MAYDYTSKLTEDALARYKQKLRLIGEMECPYSLPAGSWVDDPTKWPSVQWPDVFSYLVDTPGIYTREAMKNYKSLEAHTFFVSGWVQTIMHLKKGDVTVMKTSVTPSYRVNEEPHKPWIAVNKDGQILCAHCDCMAGLGESCSHVAALLFKVEAAVRMGYTTLACTEEPCRWNKCFTKKVKPSKVANIQFYSKAAKDRLRTTKLRKVRPPPPPATCVEEAIFLNTLQKVSTTPIVLSTYEGLCAPFKEKKRIHPVSFPLPVPDVIANLPSDAGSKQCIDHLAISQAQQKYVVDQTMGQSVTAHWSSVRVGRITSSTAHSVLHTSTTKPAPSLLRQLCQESRNRAKSAALTWGTEKEAEAFTEYAEHQPSYSHSDMQVIKTGIHISLATPFLAASPDGLIQCTCCAGKGILEIKCPYSARDVTDVDTLVCRMPYLTPQCTLAKSHSYYTQMQMQMYACERQYGDFVVWTPKLSLVIRVSRDEEFITSMVRKCTTFWTECLFPALRKHSELPSSSDDKPSGPVATTSTSPQVNDSSYAFCYCKKDTDETMIGCDNPSCAIQWFHLSCIKRKRAPKGDWYCKDCKASS